MNIKDKLKIKLDLINNQIGSCNKCANWKTVNCPNSSICFSTVDKPYFKIKEEFYDK